MSDNWVQCPICGGDVGDEAVADYDRAAYETGVRDSMLRATQYERILTDLIAELRSEHYPHSCTDPEDFPCCCQECRGHWPCGIEAAARSAERRLREMEDE
jgi:hypothetical protein